MKSQRKKVIWSVLTSDVSFSSTLKILLPYNRIVNKKPLKKNYSGPFCKSAFRQKCSKVIVQYLEGSGRCGEAYFLRELEVSCL